MNASTLSETLDALTSLAIDRDVGVRVVGMEVRLPVDVTWGGRGMDDFVVTAPRWRWRTDFDRDPGALWVRFAESGDGS